MATDKSLSDQAADLLRQAFTEPNNGERWLLIEEALRLHRIATALEQARGLDGVHIPRSALPQTDDEPAP